MTLATIKARSAASLARVGAFEKDESVSIVLPDDLSTLSTAELVELHGKAVAAFQELHDDETPLSAKAGVLRDLKAAAGALAAEKATRDEAEATLAAEFAEAPVALAAEEAPAAEVEAPVVEEAPAEVVAEEVPAPVVAASHPRTISVPAIKARQTPVVEVISEPTSPYRAPVNVPGLQAGAVLNTDEVAAAFADMVSRAPKNSNGIFSTRTPVAHIEKNFDPRAIVTGDNAQDAIDFVTKESNLKGGSLVAAGGWCAPSATVYDLCQLESTDGLLSVPEVQVHRGGIRFTTGPDWADIFASTGFCFDEADDIAGTYITNENQSLTEGGSGLTSFTLTFGGQTTGSIPASTTAVFIQNALENLSTIGIENVYVTGPAGSSTGPWNVQFVNALGNTDVATITSTPTGGSGTLVVAVVNQGGGVAGVKPTNIVPCPSFTDVRLNVCGVTIQAGNLMDRAYPELVRRYVSGAVTAHAHRVATNVLQSMIAQSTAVSPTAITGESAALSPVLSAIELEVEDMRYRRRMARGSSIEAIFPFWVRGVIRADLSRRLGVDASYLAVTDAQIDAWFRQRGINPQFIYNFDNIGAPTAALAWPKTVRFLLYPAGTFVRGSSDIITIEMLRDSTLNANNNFTAIFTEEAWSVMKMCHDARIVTVAVCPTGVTAAGATLTCP